jgi:uncharacterized protein (TIGR02145 family)
MKENLDVGTRINGIQDQTDNGIIEKYCYEDNPDSCSKYGGLYLWDEMMQFSTGEKSQGICPPGWHVPSDEEWKVLEGEADSQFGIGDPEWDKFSFRGFDAGRNLKSQYGWVVGGNGTDLYGFSCLPGGCQNANGWFINTGYFGYLSTSTEDGSLYKWDRTFSYDNQQISRHSALKRSATSVRCIRD